VISASGPHEDLSKEALVSRVEAELGTTIGVSASTLWSQVITEKRATFSCRSGLERASGTTPLPGLLLAGDYIASDYPGTIEGAVRSGIAAGSTYQNFHFDLASATK